MESQQPYSQTLLSGLWDRLEHTERTPMSDSLEFRLLKYIVAVAETSNFTRAAERLSGTTFIE